MVLNLNSDWQRKICHTLSIPKSRPGTGHKSAPWDEIISASGRNFTIMAVYLCGKLGKPKCIVFIFNHHNNNSQTRNRIRNWKPNLFGVEIWL